MTRLAKALAMALALPVVVTALGLLGQARWESRWDPLFQRQVATQRVLPYGGLLKRPSLVSVCADPRTAGLFTPCTTYNLFSKAIAGSVVVGGAGLAFLGGLVLAGRWYRGARRRMVRLFRPTLAATAVGIACLAVGQGLLAVAAGVAGGAALWFEPVERASGAVLLTTGAAALGWIVAVTTVAFGLIRRPTISLVGQVLDLSDQRRLNDLLGTVSASVGAEPPDHVVVCLVPWLFVTGTNVTCLDRRLSGRTLCLSLPLARILSVDELRGLLAHEMARYSREQAPVTVRVALPLAGVSRAIQEAAGRARGFRAAVWWMPLTVLSIFVGEAAAGEYWQGDAEPAADQRAAAVAGREAFASGLVKVAAFSPAWHGVFALMQHAAYTDSQYVNVSAMFQEVATSNVGDDRLTGAEWMVQGHPVDRHATLGERLASLGLHVRDVAGAALVTTPQPPATSLIDGCEAIEQRLSRAEHQLIVETGGRIPRA